MEEDLLVEENNKKSRWDVDIKYFGELVSRSFFQQVKESRYLMHDLMHDLVKSIIGTTCLNAREHKSKAYENISSLARARRASFVPTFTIIS